MQMNVNMHMHAGWCYCTAGYSQTLHLEVSALSIESTSTRVSFWRRWWRFVREPFCSSWCCRCGSSPAGRSERARGKHSLSLHRSRCFLHNCNSTNTNTNNNTTSGVFRISEIGQRMHRLLFPVTFWRSSPKSSLYASTAGFSNLFHFALKSDIWWQ